MWLRRYRHDCRVNISCNEYVAMCRCRCRCQCWWRRSRGLIFGDVDGIGDDSGGGGGGGGGGIARCSYFDTVGVNATFERLLTYFTKFQFIKITFRRGRRRRRRRRRRLQKYKVFSKSATGATAYISIIKETII